MSKTKLRRDNEVYEDYWKFTAAHTDIYGNKFTTSLTIIINFIDKNQNELIANASLQNGFKNSNLYKELIASLVTAFNLKGNDAGTSARKIVNQFVKIGFVKPYLVGYNSNVPEFLSSNDKDKKRILFSKIFYEDASLLSDVTVDNRSIKHIPFFLNTLLESGPIEKNDIIAMMTTNIVECEKGYLTREELDNQFSIASNNNFAERKYNQISHLKSYLKHFIDVVYDDAYDRFYFKDDPILDSLNLEKSYTRDNVKHKIYKSELIKESKDIYNRTLCYLEKIDYKYFIASHIKPLKTCLLENKEDEAYDSANGLLLSRNIDAYFDKFEISFDENGKILFSQYVDEEVIKRYQDYKLDDEILTDKRKIYLIYHRDEFEKKRNNKC